MQPGKNRDAPRFHESRNRGASLNSQKGFTYIALLLAVAVTGAALAAVGELSSFGAQRERERELLRIGGEFRAAIGSFYERTPGGAKRYPASLGELLEDRRPPVPQRHLRRIYPDPMTGKAEWGLIEAPGGGIMGVYSLSESAPVKTGNFSPENESFADARRYADWTFLHRPKELAASPAGNTPHVTMK